MCLQKMVVGGCVRRLTTVCMSKPNQDRDRVASKYCFKASAQLKEKATGRIIGCFTGYDKTMEIAAEVTRLCESHRLEDDDLTECTLSKLVLFEECPTECDGAVAIVFYDGE